MSILIFVLFVLVSLIILIMTKNREHHDSLNRQVPLNYFTLNEPAYFFYDPEVAFTYKDNVVTNNLENGKLFGENNYLRYYLDGKDTYKELNFNIDLKR